MIRGAKAISVTILLAAACCTWGYGQAVPATILEVDVTNRVQYFEDTADLSKFATDPSRTTPILPKNFTESVIISDIVAVNGQPVKGTVVEHTRMLGLTTTPSPGQDIADVVCNNIPLRSFE